MHVYIYEKYVHFFVLSVAFAWNRYHFANRKEKASNKNHNFRIKSEFANSLMCVLWKENSNFFLDFNTTQNLTIYYLRR
jgi:hypothetical protein